jgi:UDP-N-acetylmuramate--alanine ligase
MNVAGTKIHFMGIGGIGVSALAELADREGAVVSGCDLTEGVMTRHLRDLGIPVTIGHDRSHVNGVDLVVYSSAVPPENPERAAAERRCRTMRRGTFLARLLEERRVFAVCGTHGKTTTTWLLGQLLRACNLDPTVIVGGVGVGEESNLHVGRSKHAVVELDESDESFLEPRVLVGVVTNIEADHLDHYGSAEQVEAAYARFVEQLGPEGILVACVDDPTARRLLEASGAHTIGVGLDPCATLRAEAVEEEGMAQSFRLVNGTGDHGRFRLPLPGVHNLRNALAALGAARAVGADWEELRGALAECRAVGRRFERVGEAGGVTVVDDYAHHPTEIAATLQTARGLHDGRLLAVFQPHLYSRTRELAEGFGRALAAADRVYVVDIYPAREEPVPGVDSELVTAAVCEHNGEVSGPYSRTGVAAAVAEEARPGDLVLFLGAGDIGASAHELLELL